MDNPLAFPMCNEKQSQQGMTLLDYFEGQSLKWASWLGNSSDVAEGCYEIADKMLKEWSK